VFLALHAASPALRRLASTPGGVLAVARRLRAAGLVRHVAARDPGAHRPPPSITSRWWVQLLGHIAFVAVPIVASIGLGAAAPAPAPARPAARPA
jgi:hypothetical protein